MKTGNALKYRALTLLVLVALPAYAARTLTTIPLRLSGQFNYRKNWLCDPTTKADQQGIYGATIPVANRVVVSIDIVNVSDVTQTGKLEFSVAAGGMIGETYCGYAPGSAYIFQNTLVLCPNTYTGGAGAHGTTYSVTGPTTNVPSPVTWSLAPGERRMMSGELWSQGVYGNTAATGCEVAGVIFQPTFKITVNEDKGALAGAITYQLMGTTTSGTTVTCSGKTYSGSWDGCIKPEPPLLPLPLNGGRPF